MENITKKAYRKRPKANDSLDQVHMDLKSLIKTCNILKNRIKNKKIFVIGDDDLFSIGFHEYCNPKNITTIDIDKRILNYIKILSKRYGLKIKLKKHDIKEELPRTLKNSFDFFYTNPPYGSKNKGRSCIAFIARGLKACKIDGCGAFVLPHKNYSEWCNEVNENVIKYLKKIGCKTINKWENIHCYKNNNIESSLFLIKKCQKFKIEENLIKETCLY